MAKTALAVALVGTAGLAAAQTDARIEEIVVTAQQREQNLQDVPISISAFTSEAIEKNMFSDVGDYVTRTPNASFTSNGARSRRSISIRGVTNFLVSSSALRTSTFGFYVDGFNVAGSSINPPIMDIERIEILRGPQATYFGRNALGGGINITSKKPENDFGGSVIVDYSRFNTLDIEGVLNLPLVEDVLAARVNVKRYSTDGFIENINPLGGGNDATYDYVKLSLRYTPTDNLTVDLTGSIANEEVGMREGIPSGVFSTFAGDVLYADFPDRDGDGLPDPDPDGVGFYPSNRTKVNFNSPQTVGTDFKYLVNRVDYEFADLLFTSITGYMESDFFLQGDIDGGSGDFFNEIRTIPRDSISQEFRLQNTGTSNFTWNLGLLYARDRGAVDNRTFVGEAQPFDLPVGFLIDSEDSKEEAENWAIFGQADYKLTDRLTVSLGGRYSEETKEANIRGFSGTLETVLSVEDTFTDFSPRLALNYELRDNVSLYATASKGFKSGGVQISPFPGAESFEPETLWNYEVGAKSDLFDNRLRLNLALFYMDWEDLQTAFQQAGLDENGDFILFGGIDNAEKATSTGVELTATALFSDNLVVNFTAGYLEAEYDKFTAFIDGANRVLDGETIPNSPKWTFSADAEYGFDINADLSGYVRAEWTYRDEIQSSTSALIQSGFPWQVPSYDYVDLRAGVEHERFSVVAYVDNLFDSKYFTNAYQKAFTGGLHIEPSYRTFGLRLTYNFD
ncbi:TonB-dependent receptor [Exilibacterium tricleocarpae]|uniref:TonB-dependent receptor n=2 Tax=Exilibacterium tricleocarpae TaxID=2591008 RepID=A0A545TZV3_9GAMM|nr:TonB-dependent receptor [Exilibacterium tricleocarpae]